MPDHFIQAITDAAGAEDIDALLASCSADPVLAPISQALADALANLSNLDSLLNAEGSKAQAVELRFDSGADGTGEPEDHAAYVLAAMAMNSVERLYGQRQLIAGHFDTLLHIYQAAAAHRPGAETRDTSEEN